MDENGVAAAIIPIATTFCRVSTTSSALLGLFYLWFCSFSSPYFCICSLKEFLQFWVFNHYVVFFGLQYRDSAWSS